MTMNLLNLFLNRGALTPRIARPKLSTWFATCVLKRREPFGCVTTEASYELDAESEDGAREKLRALVGHPRAASAIEAIHINRCNEVLGIP